MSTDLQPHRWSRQDLKGLPLTIKMFIQSWQESACTMIRENWNALLGASVDVRLQGIEMNISRKLISQLPDPGYGAIFRIGPNATQALVAFPAPLVKLLVADLIGISEFEQQEEFRDLTPIELSMLELLLGEIGRAWSQSWPQLQSLECHLEQIVSRPLRSRLFVPDEELVCTQYQLTSGGTNDVVTWVTPLTPFCEFIGDNIQQEVHSPPPTAQMMEKIAKQIRLSLAVELGTAQISVRELRSVTIGDVIVLDQIANSPLKSYVGNECLHLGYACHIGGRRGFRVQNQAPE